MFRFFNKPYEQAKHQYEHIGSKTLFLVKKYKTTEDDIRMNKKRNPNYKISDSSKVTLAGYITRYGEKIGTQKYYERNQKISKAQTIEWYIQKYGQYSS